MNKNNLNMLVHMFFHNARDMMRDKGTIRYHLDISIIAEVPSIALGQWKHSFS